MTDTKTYSINNNWRGEIAVGEPLHEMLVRITVDNNFIIQDVWAKTENGPFEMCPEIAPAYKALAGIQMGPGWRKSIRCATSHEARARFVSISTSLNGCVPVRSKASKMPVEYSSTVAS